jgi:hypothetical protein
MYGACAKSSLHAIFLAVHQPGVQHDQSTGPRSKGVAGKLYMRTLFAAHAECSLTRVLRIMPAALVPRPCRPEWSATPYSGSPATCQSSCNCAGADADAVQSGSTTCISAVLIRGWRRCLLPLPQCPIQHPVDRNSMMLRWPEHLQIRRTIFPVYTPKVSDFVIDFVIDHIRPNSMLGAYFYVFF